MQSVSTSVVHLGDQLESLNGPRTRAADALQLISHFDQFLSDQPLNSTIFTDPDKVRLFYYKNFNFVIRVQRNLIVCRVIDW